MTYYSGAETVEEELRRLGGVIALTGLIDDPTEYAARIVNAMKANLLAVERAYPDLHHVVMCGGKDRLNVLLLPWQTEVLVLNAPPNFALVKNFVERNGLPHRVVQIDGRDRTTLQLDIPLNACFNNLEHCRWTGELKAVVDSFDRKVVVWKSPVVDLFTTPSWRIYAHSESRLGQTHTQRITNKLHHQVTTCVEGRLLHAVWDRGAMWQGSHMSLRRPVAGALFHAAGLRFAELAAYLGRGPLLSALATCAAILGQAITSSLAMPFVSLVSAALVCDGLVIGAVLVKLISLGKHAASVIVRFTPALRTPLGMSNSIGSASSTTSNG